MWVLAALLSGCVAAGVVVWLPFLPRAPDLYVHLIWTWEVMRCLVSGQPPADHLAMTGELTLSGLVMPIGGVKEKLIAARRAGVKTVILPEENRADYEDLDQHITKGIMSHFVRSFDEVRRICFPS